MHDHPPAPTDLTATPSSPRLRILFVDEEPAVLQGIGNCLRKMRNRWEMVFVSTGEEALDACDRGAFDVVVADLLLRTGFDGFELLRRVRQMHPGSARIAVSGRVDLKALVDVVPLAHQYLTKPFETTALRSVIERACELRVRLTGRSMQDLIGSVASLPSPPTTYFEVVRLAAMPEVGLDKIAAAISSDGAMAATVLRVVNSAFFGLSRRVSSVQQAAVLLGVDVLKALALSAHVFTPPKGLLPPGFSLDNLQRHSVAMARIARTFLPDRRRADEAFTAALLADIGQIVLATGRSFDVARLLAEGQTSGRPLHELEEAHLGAGHGDVGAFLLGLWGLPPAIVDAVAYHHRPSAVHEACLEQPDVLGAVHVAAALVDAHESPRPGDEPRIESAFLHRAGLASVVATWRARAASALRRADPS